MPVFNVFNAFTGHDLGNATTSKGLRNLVMASMVESGYHPSESHKWERWLSDVCDDVDRGFGFRSQGPCIFRHTVVKELSA